MKKTMSMVMVCCALSLSMVFPAFANDWLIDPSTYKHDAYDDGTGNEEWRDAEAIAELKQWTDARKDVIIALPDDMTKYDAVVKAVCDFLQPDLNYTFVNLHYTLKYGKGVCVDYATLTKALCDAVGIKCELVLGSYDNEDHMWNKVTLSGTEYYSDVIAVDVGMPKYKLSTTVWADHYFYETTDDIKRGFNQKWRTGKDVDAMVSAPAGTVACKDRNGVVYYITQEDQAACLAGTMTGQQLAAKYGVN